MSQLLLNTPDNRRGFFKLAVGPGAGLTLDEALAIFAGFVPMHIETDLYGGQVTYYGISPHFDEVEMGCVTPEYRAVLTGNRAGEVTDVRWLREGEREPVQYLQEPDWGLVRNAVENVIRRHEIELKVAARRDDEREELERQARRRVSGVVASGFRQQVAATIGSSHGQTGQSESFFALCQQQRMHGQNQLQGLINIWRHR